MSISRFFVIVVVVGAIAAIAFVANQQTTSSAGVTSVRAQRENITERSLELQGHQTAAGNLAGASSGMAYQNITERTLELRELNSAPSPVGWGENIAERSLELHDRQSVAGNSTIARPGPIRQNIAERSLEQRDRQSPAAPLNSGPQSYDPETLGGRAWTCGYWCSLSPAAK